MPSGQSQGAPRRVVLATSNPGKLREFTRLLAPFGCEVLAQSEFDIEPVEESGETFMPAIADDSGVAVDALGGAPGVRSARLAGDGASDGENLRALLALMEGIEEERRGACFMCVVVYMRAARDPMPIIGQGTWRGRILDSPRGVGGFGYDTAFYVPEHGASVAELSPETKNASSHRARALAALLAQLPGGGAR